jgi:hypothetical protein
MDHQRKRTAHVQQLPWIPSLRLLGKAEAVQALSKLWQGNEKGGVKNIFMYILSVTSNALWHPMQYVGLFIMAVALVCFFCSKKRED